MDDSVDTEWNGGSRPEEHHHARQPIGFLLPPIVPYLRDELDAPEDGSDCAEDVGGKGNSLLRRHSGSECGGSSTVLEAKTTLVIAGWKHTRLLGYYTNKSNTHREEGESTVKRGVRDVISESPYQAAPEPPYLGVELVVEQHIIGQR